MTSTEVGPFPIGLFTRILLFSGFNETSASPTKKKSAFGAGVAFVGVVDGTVLDTTVGIDVGTVLDTTVGLDEGDELGDSVGLDEGDELGDSVGLDDGIPDGLNDGIPDGLNDGIPDGLNDGVPDGLNDGISDGLNDGIPDGLNVGTFDGDAEIDIVGLEVGLESKLCPSFKDPEVFGFGPGPAQVKNSGFRPVR